MTLSTRAPRSIRALPALAAGFALVLGTADAPASHAGSSVVGSTRALTPTSWLTGDDPSAPYVMPTFERLTMLRQFRRPSIERRYPARTYQDGQYGLSSFRLYPRFSWSATGCSIEDEAPAAKGRAAEGTLRLAPGAQVLPMQLSGVSLLPTWALEVAPAPLEALLLADRAPGCPPGSVVRPVTLARYGGESDRFELIACDGSVAPDAIDRLSVMARPPGTRRPETPLPLEPLPESAERGEWMPGVRILHPRLLWALQRVADAFPHRPIYIISGYRQDARAGYHHKGRALDLFVMGVANEELFRICRKLRDVACGYYPNNKFVHVDIRPLGTGHPMWVDASAPGMPSEYVDAWPGVVEGGALDWAHQH